MEWVKEQWDRLRGKKSAAAILYVALLSLAVLMYGVGDGWFKARPRASPEEAQPTLETRLEDILTRMRGAGKVRVLITYETAGERVTATVSTTDESVSESTGGTTATRSEQTRETRQPATIATGQGQTPIVLLEREPQIRGVIVVAEGAADPTVRLSLQRAVQAVTGVPLSCIEVFEMGYPS